VAAVLVVGAVVVSSGDDDVAGDCLSEVAGRLPADTTVVNGTDFERARAADLDVDGSSDQLFDVVVDTSLHLDPLTVRVNQVGDDTAGTGYGIEEMRCWAGDWDTFVGRGSFDDEAVAESDAGAEGQVEVRSGLLAHEPDGDPGSLLRASPVDARARTALVDRVDRLGAVTFSGLVAGEVEGDEVWIGLGLARGDGWELVVVWGFAEPDQAAAGRDRALDALEEGVVPEMIDGDPADLLQQEGPSLALRAPLDGDAAAWVRPLQVFDPMLTAFGSSDALPD
jgi:hypothetical protein